MTRFYGSAVFEGSEVSDGDYSRLTEQRAEEASEIDGTRDEEAERIAAVKRWAEEEIARIHDETQAEIERILGGVVIKLVYELQGVPGACPLCETKIGEVGTMGMLEAKDCVPPFHDNCRCELVEVGYAVL